MQFNPISPDIGSQGQQVLPGQKDNSINYLLPVEIICKILRQPFLSDIEQAKAREVYRKDKFFLGYFRVFCSR